MSPHEHPTERHPVGPPDWDAEWRADIRDHLRSLSRWLVAVGVLALVALGIGLWALLEDDDAARVRPATVHRLEERVDELESEVERTPSRVEFSIRDEQRSIDERLDTLEQNTNETLESIRQDVEEIQQRIEELEQQQQRPTTPEQ